MINKYPFATLLSSGVSHVLLKALILLATLAIFIIDTLTSLDIAVAVLYVAVILMGIRLFSPKGLLLMSIASIVLTVFAFFLSHGIDFESSAFARCLVSLAAICITSALAMGNKSFQDALKRQVQMLGQTHDAIVLTDLQDKIELWNPGATSLYGWHFDEVKGRSSDDILATQYPSSRAEAKEWLTTHGQWEGELTQIGKDGQPVIVSSRWSLIRDNQGHPTRILITNNDVTDHKQADAALHQAQTELAHAARLSTLGELAASFSHEINQPLASITTTGEASLRWLKRDPPDLVEVTDCMNRIITEARRASEVIKRIRNLARKTEQVHAPLDLQDVVKESLALVERELKAERVIVKTQLKATPVMGDYIQLQQVVINLLLNAIQALASTEQRYRQISIALSDADPVVCTVNDNGPGLSQEVAGNMFKAFVTTKATGMGMGLSICRSIIDMHGGAINAQNREEGGASVEFTLPRLEEVSSD